MLFEYFRERKEDNDIAPVVEKIKENNHNKKEVSIQ